MIENERQLNQTRAAITDLENAVSALKREVLEVNPARFALMAEAPVAEIRQLREQIDEFVGIRSAILQEAELWMRIEGPTINIGDAPTSVVTALLDILRRGVQSVAEFIQRGAVGIRPTASLKEACDLRIVDWLPGSVQVGLRLPEIPTQPDELESPVKQAREALSLYLQAASVVGTTEEPADMVKAIPDAGVRRVLLNQISRLVPRPRGAAEQIEFYGRYVPQGSIRLDRSAQSRVRRALAQTIPEELVTVQGLLREIDLDERSFIIRNPEEAGKETRCQIVPENDDLLEIAKECLDHTVIVRGTRPQDPTRKRTNPLRVEGIEALDGDIDASME